MTLGAGSESGSGRPAAGSFCSCYGARMVHDLRDEAVVSRNQTKLRTGAKCLVHCKMGVSRSASTVVAYAMKEFGWDLDTALHHIRERRAVAKPNPGFMKQLEEYQGILLASKQRHNKLWRSHSDADLSGCSVVKPASHAHSSNTSSHHVAESGRGSGCQSGGCEAPGPEEFLGVAQDGGCPTQDHAPPKGRTPPSGPDGQDWLDMDRAMLQDTDARLTSDSQGGGGVGRGPDCEGRSHLARGNQELQTFLQSSVGQDQDWRWSLRGTLDTEPSSGPTPLGLGF